MSLIKVVPFNQKLNAGSLVDRFVPILTESQQSCLKLSYKVSLKYEYRRSIRQTIEKTDENREKKLQNI